MLAPVSLATFHETYWDRQSLHLPGPPDKFAGLFDEAALRAAINRRPHSIKAGGSSTTAAMVTPEQFDALYACGLTMCVQMIQEVNEDLDRFCRTAGTQLGLIETPVFNCYVSPDGKGFPLHCDSHTVVILQISGAKRWRYGAQPVAPTLNQSLFDTPEYLQGHNLAHPGQSLRAPDPSDLIEQVLEPGHLLYLPRGTWHTASAIERSVALTWALYPTPFLQFLFGALSSMFEDAGVPTAPTAAPEQMPPAVDQYLAQQLDRLRARLDGMTPEDLQPFWRSMVFPGRQVPDTLVAELLRMGVLGSPPTT